MQDTLEKRISNQVDMIEDLQEELKEMTDLANHLQEKSAREKRDIEIKVGEDTYNIGEKLEVINNLHDKMRELCEDLNELHHTMEIDDRVDSQRKLKRIKEKL